MQAGFNFTIAAAAEWIDSVLKTMFKFAFSKVTQTKAQQSQ